MLVFLFRRIQSTNVCDTNTVIDGIAGAAVARPLVRILRTHIFFFLSYLSAFSQFTSFDRRAAAVDYYCSRRSWNASP